MFDTFVHKVDGILGRVEGCAQASLRDVDIGDKLSQAASSEGIRTSCKEMMRTRTIELVYRSMFVPAMIQIGDEGFRLAMKERTKGEQLRKRACHVELSGVS